MNAQSYSTQVKQRSKNVGLRYHLARHVVDAKDRSDAPSVSSYVTVHHTTVFVSASQNRISRHASGFIRPAQHERADRGERELSIRTAQKGEQIESFLMNFINFEIEFMPSCETMTRERSRTADS